MALTDQVLHPESLTSDATATYLTMGLPWFRSLPWGAVAGLSIHIDGAEFGPAQLHVQPEWGGQWVPLSSLAGETREWFVQDRHTVRIGVPTEPGPHQVRAIFQLVMPNLFSAPGQPISFPSAVEAQLEVA